MSKRLKRLTEKKQKLDAFRPFPKELIREFEEWLRVELTYSSNAIEGNTLSRLETAEVIEKGVVATISGKPLKDQLEAINHAKAIDFVKKLAKKKKSHQFITEKEIKDLHQIVLSGINDQWAGKYRQTEVFVKGVDVEFPSPYKVPYLMKQFILWLEKQQKRHLVRIAAEAHFKFVSIHPFVDGNGRVGRLLMNLILVINSYPMAIVRNEERIAYLESVNRGQTKNDLKPFYTIIENSVERLLDAYLNILSGRPAIPSFKKDTKFKKTKLLKIGELARATGETIHTIRFWTKEGLLKVVGKTRGGYQLYVSSMIDQVREIRRLQKERRLTIGEIKKELREAGI